VCQLEVCNFDLFRVSSLQCPKIQESRDPGYDPFSNNILTGHVTDCPSKHARQTNHFGAISIKQPLRTYGHIHIRWKHYLRSLGGNKNQESTKRRRTSATVGQRAQIPLRLRQTVYRIVAAKPRRTCKLFTCRAISLACCQFWLAGWHQCRNNSFHGSLRLHARRPFYI